MNAFVLIFVALFFSSKAFPQEDCRVVGHRAVLGANFELQVKDVRCLDLGPGILNFDPPKQEPTVFHEQLGSLVSFEDAQPAEMDADVRAFIEEEETHGVASVTSIIR